MGRGTHHDPYQESDRSGTVYMNYGTLKEVGESVIEHMGSMGRSGKCGVRQGGGGRNPRLTKGTRSAPNIISSTL
jgi:hypothetical protein